MNPTSQPSEETLTLLQMLKARKSVMGVSNSTFIDIPPLNDEIVGAMKRAFPNTTGLKSVNGTTWYIEGQHPVFPVEQIGKELGIEIKNAEVSARSI